MRNRITYAGKEFSDDLDAAYRITTGDCLLETSPLSDSLAANTLEFEVDSADTGLVQYVRNDKMVYEHRGRRLGTFYVQSVGRVGRQSYQFSAVSAVGLLMGKTHYGGLYTGQTAEEVILDIVAGTGVTVEIKSIFRDYQLYGWLPIATARDNLAQVLFAIGACLRTMTNGVLRVTSLYGGVSWARGAGSCFTGGAVDYGTPVARVIVTEHRWEAGTESRELFNGAANQGDIIRFDEPVHSLQANGFTILESNCNYAKVSAGTGTLTGTPYLHHMRDITKQVSEAGDDVTVKEAYLVSLVNSVGVAERLAEFYAHRETVTQEVVWDGEQPGDVVRTAHPYGGTAEVFLASADLAMSGILRASEEGVVGYRPHTPESQTYYDFSELLTGSGEWTVPEGVDNVTAVLIGPGTGGRGGSPGTSDGRYGYGSYAGGIDGSTTIYYLGGGIAGEGGEAGTPGSPGKVFQATMDVAPGQKIAYNCPAGGAGGAANSNGAAGQPTTFGSLSSDAGAVLESGYTDPITQTVYAQPGQAGVKGGRGTGADGTGRDWKLVQGENVVYNGVTYRPGSTGKSNAGNCSGGYGGGPAAGANGGNGKDAPTATSRRAQVGDGGNGATPVTPPQNPQLGGGGHAGHGGGGAGGQGNGANSAANYLVRGYPGSGGAGGRGGQGGNGGILLYYRKPQAIQSGRFRGKNGQIFFAKGRTTLAV